MANVQTRFHIPIANIQARQMTVMARATIVPVHRGKHTIQDINTAPLQHVTRIYVNAPKTGTHSVPQIIGEPRMYH